MKSFLQINVREQRNCSEQFTEILPRPAMGQREYGRSDDRRLPDSDYAAFGQIVFKGRDRDGELSCCVPFFLLAYHPRSVITRSLAFEAGAWKRILSLKLSERISHARLDLLGALFLLYPGFFFFFFTVEHHLSPSVLPRTANPKGTNRKTKWNNLKLHR